MHPSESKVGAIRLGQNNSRSKQTTSARVTGASKSVHNRNKCRSFFTNAFVCACTRVFVCVCARMENTSETVIQPANENLRLGLRLSPGTVWNAMGARETDSGVTSIRSPAVARVTGGRYKSKLLIIRTHCLQLWMRQSLIYVASSVATCWSRICFDRVLYGSLGRLSVRFHLLLG